MNRNSRIYFYRKLPLPILPLVLFALIILAVIVILGFFVGAILGAFLIGYVFLRHFISSKKKKTATLEEDGRTIVLKEGDYEVLEKGGNRDS
jgi:uncharacterized membrane protein